MKNKLIEIYTHYIDISKINNDSVIVDCGASTGAFIDEFRKYSNCKIIAIEPDDTNCEILRNKNYDNVILSNKCLVGMDGNYNMIGEKILFYSAINSELGSIHKEKRVKYTKRIWVDVLRINNILTEFNIDKIDFLKMDIEGAEIKILSTVDKNIMSKVYQLSIELHYVDNTKLKEMKKILKGFGFKIEIFKGDNETLFEIYGTKII